MDPLQDSGVEVIWSPNLFRSNRVLTAVLAAVRDVDVGGLQISEVTQAGKRFRLWLHEHVILRHFANTASHLRRISVALHPTELQLIVT